MPAKVYLRILQGGIIASLLIVFFVFRDLLFPYITSKQLSFNILMEVLLVFWLVFITRYPSFRPKKNYILFGLIAYFIAILASCFGSVNFDLSFWGNAERMLGFFSLLHFLIFYLIVITVFRTWQEWKALFLSSVVIATLVSIMGLVGQNTYSTIGNTAYVSGYLIFNLFFALILFFRSNSNWRWLYALPAVIMLFEFWSCHTSGAIIGLFLSLILLLFLLGLFYGHKGLRRVSLIVVGVLIIVVIGIFSQAKSAWFQNSFLRNLTFEKTTFQTRLISWRAAAADFQYHPWFGTGLGNYAIIFDKHFDSKFFNYTTTETYFDRAHNNLIDIASTTGLFGLLTYLSIFVAALYYLILMFKSNGGRAGLNSGEEKTNFEILIIISLLAAYFIQNLVVFDSLVTYVGLLMTLGFIYWLVFSAREETENSGEEKGIISPQWELLILIILLALAGLFINQYNLKPWRMFRDTITGYTQILEGDLTDGIATYKQALTGSPLEHDAASTLISVISSNPVILNSVSRPEAQDILDYVLSLAQRNVSQNPKDSLMQMQLAQLADTIARFDYQDQAKFNYYSTLALQAVDKSIASSPGRAPVYFVKAQMLLVRNQKDEAIKTAQYGISLNPQYYEGYCRLAQFYYVLNDDKDMGAQLSKCINLGGLDTITSDSLLKKAITYYISQKDYATALKLSEKQAASSSDGNDWLNLAKLYLINNDLTSALAAGQQAIRLDSSLTKDWNSILNTLKGLPSSTSSKVKK